VAYNGPERRAPIADRIAQIEEQLEAGAKRMDGLEKTLAENTKLTSEVHSIIGHATSFFSVLGWVGNGIKWIAAVLAAVGAVWAIYTGRTPGN